MPDPNLPMTGRASLLDPSIPLFVPKDVVGSSGLRLRSLQVDGLLDGAKRVFLSLQKQLFPALSGAGQYLLNKDDYLDLSLDLLMLWSGVLDRS